MPVAATGVNYIDSLLKFNSWSGNANQAVTINYNFSVARDPSVNAGMPVSFESTVQGALQQFSNVANISFNLTNNNNSLNRALFFGQTDLGPGVLGATSTMSTTGSRIDQMLVLMDDRFTNSSNLTSGITPGTLGYFTLLHEIGHALGLEHPGPYAGSELSPHLPGNEDNIQNTMMSYYNGPLVDEDVNAPRTLMIYDIAAIQYLYGANYSYNAGNDTYNFTGATLTQTIWDGAGSDTISASGAGVGATIDLREGINNVTTIGATRLWMAFGANIENATGSAQADALYGNGLSNTMTANAGNDTMYGNGGDDNLSGNDGNDFVDGGAGNDMIFGNLGDDTINGNIGNDVIYGDNNTASFGHDLIHGNAGDDVIISSQGNDTIFGDEGNDQLYCGDGNDSIEGGIGNDLIEGNLGNDTVRGGDGDDYLLGDNNFISNGDDIVYGDAGNDSLVTSSGNDTAYGGTGGDSLFLGADNDLGYGEAGNDTIEGHLGNDTLWGGSGVDWFCYKSGQTGADMVMDFEGAGVVGGDKITLVSNINGSGLMTAADYAAAMQYAGGNATLNMGGGMTLTLVGISTPLIADDFMVV